MKRFKKKDNNVMLLKYAIKVHKYDIKVYKYPLNE